MDTKIFNGSVRILRGDFWTRVIKKGSKTPMQPMSLTGNYTACIIYEHSKISDPDRTVLDISDLLKIGGRHTVQAFHTKWDETRGVAMGDFVLQAMRKV